MQLPYIAVEGIGNTREEILQSLIETEMVLWMLGYNKPDEYFNNSQMLEYGYNNDKNKPRSITHIVVNPKIKYLGYFSHNGTGKPQRFKSTELMSLINYVEQFKNK